MSQLIIALGPIELHGPARRHGDWAGVWQIRPLACHGIRRLERPGESDEDRAARPRETQGWRQGRRGPLVVGRNRVGFGGIIDQRPRAVRVEHKPLQVGAAGGLVIHQTKRVNARLRHIELETVPSPKLKSLTDSFRFPKEYHG